MTQVLLTPLRRIATPSGDVLHAMKDSDAGFAGFGEAYFSIVHQGAIKGWKQHQKMTLNLVCIQGAIRVVAHDGDLSSAVDVVLSPGQVQQYQRLTVPPLFWVAFQGLDVSDNVLLNLASCPHDPQEAKTADLASFAWSW